MEQNRQRALHTVIMAGGRGTRFWPLSRASKPKQFIDILGTGESLLQMAYARARRSSSPDHIWVVGAQAHAELLYSQLPDLDPQRILLEPIGRNTAPCAAYALQKIRQVDAEAILFFVPSDQLITDDACYERDVQQVKAHVGGQDRITLFGIAPNRPETGYGYIEISKGQKSISSAISFHEKPDLSTAQQYLQEKNFFWNSGMLMASVKALQEEFRRYLPEIVTAFTRLDECLPLEQPEELERIYEGIESISLDYGILEKSHKVDVLKGHFGWSDLGTWQSAWQHMLKDEAGNAVKGKVLLEDCENMLVQLPEGVAAAIHGLNGYVIAMHEHALLIMPKTNDSTRLSSILEQMRALGLEEWL